MNKLKLFLSLLVIVLLSACGVKKQYNVIDQSSKKPSWVEIRDVDELTDKYNDGNSFVVADAESNNKTICEREAKSKGPVAFKEQITQSIQDQFFGDNTTDEVEASVIKKTAKSVNAVAGRITGVKVKDTYWELRQNDPEKGADNKNKFYHCNTLFSMDAKQLKSLKDNVYKIYEKEIQQTGEQSIKNDFVDMNKNND